MQVLRSLVGEKGFVVGIDLTPVKAFEWDNVISFVADFRHVDASTLLSRFPKAVDIVVSDAAPNVSGIWELDHARQIELAEHAFGLSRGLLRGGGNFFVKVFQGDLLNAFRGSVESHFRKVKLLKPRACRKESAEMYLLATGYNRTKRG
jgi:23S rRNA (uridine2552-2'-O)-methyltransferase